jgi:hypothetical protein
MYLGKSKETSDITMGGTLESETTADKGSKESQAPSVAEGPKTESHPTTAGPTQGQSQPEADTIQRPITSSSWLGGWLGLSTAHPPEVQKDSITLTTSEQQPSVVSQQIPQQEPAMTVPAEGSSKQIVAHTASTSWFGLWSTAAPSTVEEAPTEQIPVNVTENSSDTAAEGVPVAKPTTEPTAGSTWAFWSTDATKKGPKPTEDLKDSGQLVIAGEASQSHPEPAKITTVKDEKKSSRSTKRGRPASVEVDELPRSLAQVAPTSSIATPSQSPAPAKTAPPNLLIPSVKSTYHLVENASILQQIARLLLHGQQRPVKHVFLAQDPPKFKKALAIGIHGLFPAPLLRTVIGQPTGTSIRFANHAAAAIRRWGDQHGCVDCEIEKVALEGEGKIAERVDNLWKLLLNWIDHVRKADFIMIACHSQGVPVALMLVAKLIEFGVVCTGKIGVCAMGKLSIELLLDIGSLIN